MLQRLIMIQTLKTANTSNPTRTILLVAMNTVTRTAGEGVSGQKHLETLLA